jgi:hypothetical protein
MTTLTVLRRLITLAPHINAVLAWAVACGPRLVVAGALLAVGGATYTVFELTNLLTPVSGFGPAATVAGVGLVSAARIWHRFQLTVDEDN